MNMEWLVNSELTLLVLLALSTLVSEDLATISAGVLILQGKIGFFAGTLACFAGIFTGDVLLFLCGRWLGQPALSRAPLKWFVSPDAVQRSSDWLSQRGALVIALSRFVPGTRLPVYFLAGTLNTSFQTFILYFFIACALWTPLLIGLSMWLGGGIIESALLIQQRLVLRIALAGIILFPLVKLLPHLLTWRGRRLLLSSWRRLTRWEFWPMWAFYPPVILYILWLAIRYRSLTLFTICNPAIPASGFVGESKAAILEGLQESSKFIARHALIRSAASLSSRLNQAGEWMQAAESGFPVVLKPDAGERGTNVRIVRTGQQLMEYLREFHHDTIIQEYIPGCEFGVFYYRFPHQSRGQIFSITEKRMTEVIGDGHHSLEDLILGDARAVCQARTFLKNHQSRLTEVPSLNERVRMTELGSHCRGALFLDGIRLKTEALETAIDGISRRYKGFYFGRYDIRAASAEAFQRGEFKIIELNGVTSEATHIYDPRNSVFTAWRTLATQWRIAFEIGREHQQRGLRPLSVREFLRLNQLLPEAKVRSSLLKSVSE